MTLQSPVFQPHTTIPEEYTAHGRDISPPLHWQDVPQDAKELVLICEDTDSVRERPFPNPTPGTGQHHYHFKLYAIDYKLNLEPGRSRSEVETAMQGHILAEAETVGLHRDH